LIAPIQLKERERERERECVWGGERKRECVCEFVLECLLLIIEITVFVRVIVDGTHSAVCV